MNRYFYTLRPPGIGCQPDGFTARQAEVPRRTSVTPSLELAGRLVAKGVEINNFGWVEYTEPLTLDQMFRFDLLPCDTLKLLEYRAWEEYGRGKPGWNPYAPAFNSWIDERREGDPQLEGSWVNDLFTFLEEQPAMADPRIPLAIVYYLGKDNR